MNRLTRISHHVKRLRALTDRWVWLRLIAFGLIFVGSGLALYQGGIWWFTVVFGLTISLFVGSVLVHRRIEQTLQAFETWQQLLEENIARRTLDWEHIPERPVAQRSGLEIDCNLTGERSLQQLLDSAVTEAGSSRLREWLTTAVLHPPTIQQRQSRVAELLRLAAWRNKLQIVSRLATSDENWSVDDLLRWAGTQEAAPGRDLVIGLWLLAATNALTFMLDGLGLLPSLFWQLGLALYVLLSALNLPKVQGDLFGHASHLRDAFTQMLAVLQLIERRRFTTTPGLEALVAPVQNAPVLPSGLLKRLSRVASATSLRRNPFLWLPLNLIVPWDFTAAYQMEQARRQAAETLPRWLNVWFELEALTSLANFAARHPDYPFPELVPAKADDSGPLLEVEQLIHPLIQPCVPNNLRFDGVREMVLLTGSNMAGKSTLLRTLGVNFALAGAGGVVAGVGFRYRPLRLYTAINVTDSVTDGISYFYAEVRRLKGLLDALAEGEKPPVLYLIDEIFRGTNNEERRIGSQAYLKALARETGLGLVSTHDLDLVRLADESSAIRNYHFREEVVNGKMVFDYILRPGPSPTTNALEIMRLSGLPTNE